MPIASARIRNITAVPLTLPSPYRGVLPGGEIASVSDNTTTTVANLGGGAAIQGMFSVEVAPPNEPTTFHDAGGVRTAVAVATRSYGAQNDGQTGADGAMTNGSATLTSPSAPFKPTDAGKMVLVIGAGAASAVLVTKIAAFLSKTQVTLAVAASTTVSGIAFAWGTDDSAAIQAALNAAGQNQSPEVSLGSGTIMLATGLALPNNVHVRGDGESKTLVICGLPRGDFSATTVPFFGDYSFTNPSTLAANLAANSNTISSNFGYPVGSRIHIGPAESGGAAFHDFQRTVIASSGAGPYTLTLDAPIPLAIGAGASSVLGTLATFPRHITISDMTISGPCTRWIELLEPFDCEVRDVVLDNTYGDTMETLLSASFDTGARDCRWVRVQCRSLYGLGFEGCEECVGTDCKYRGSLLLGGLTGGSASLFCADSVRSGWVRSEAYGAQNYGFAFTADGNTRGCLDCFAEDCAAVFCRHGAIVIAGSTDTRFTGYIARGCTTGALRCETTSRRTIVEQSQLDIGFADYGVDSIHFGYGVLIETGADVRLADVTLNVEAANSVATTFGIRQTGAGSVVSMRDVRFNYDVAHSAFTACKSDAASTWIMRDVLTAGTASFAGSVGLALAAQAVARLTQNVDLSAFATLFSLDPAAKLDGDLLYASVGTLSDVNYWLGPAATGLGLTVADTVIALYESPAYQTGGNESVLSVYDAVNGGWFMQDLAAADVGTASFTENVAALNKTYALNTSTGRIHLHGASLGASGLLVYDGASMAGALNTAPVEFATNRVAVGRINGVAGYGAATKRVIGFAVLRGVSYSLAQYGALRDSIAVRGPEQAILDATTAAGGASTCYLARDAGATWAARIGGGPLLTRQGTPDVQSGAGSVRIGRAALAWASGP
jgi:hypothetical protein